MEQAARPPCYAGVEGRCEQMDTFTRITVPLSKDEFTALRDAAGQEYRHPREHARWLLRQALLAATGMQSRPMSNRADEVLTDPSAVAATN